MKKNLLVAIGILFLTACSSGTTVSEEPINLTGVFTGTFQNTPNTLDGTVTLNISQATGTTAISGNVIFDSTMDRGACMQNGTVTGTVSGFTLSLNIEQTGGDSTGTLSMQLTQANNGRQLDGTYVTTGVDRCSGESGSGTITLSR